MSIDETATHGSIIYAKDSSILQVVGIPSPPNLIPVIPKYVPCRKGPWKRPSGPYCRVIDFYGPLGVKSAITRIGMSERLDPLYSSAIPYIYRSEILYVIEPREAMNNLAVSARFHYYTSLIEKISRESSVSIENLGITGSVAAGIAVHGLSDLDIIVYGNYNAVKMFEYFKSRLSRIGPLIAKRNHGGVKSSPIDIGWRRQQFNNSMFVSWIGVGFSHEKCAPLKSYWSIESPDTRRIVKTTLYIKPWQETALTYPPCVHSNSGVHIISFEYNIGTLLYQGGKILIEGVPSISNNTIYLGLREFPGGVYRIRAS